MAAETYPIKPDCPAPRHNTLNAARGVRSRSSKLRKGYGCQVSGFPPCICDRAVELNEAFMARRRAMYGKRKSAPVDPATRLAESERHRRTAILNALADVPRPPVAEPDFTEAACRTPRGVVTMDAYMDAPKSESNVAAAREVCKACPVVQGCDEWVMASERLAGSWGGMYAGMTPRNRRDRAIAEHEKREAERILLTSQQDTR